MHGNTDNISHVPILTWPGVTSSLTSHGSVNDITQHFSLNSFLVLSFDTKMSHFKRRWKVLWANQCYGNLPFILINMSFRKTVSLKHFLILILWQILLHSKYQMVYMLGLYIVYLSTSRMLIFIVNSESTISPMLNFFGECMSVESTSNYVHYVLQ